MRPPLTIEQSGVVFERLEDLPIVLIGGQALNYWCNFYAAGAPELAGGVFTSKDVDFQGTAEDMMTAAVRLGARPVTSGEFPFLGYVPFDPDGQGEIHIDFLTSPLGLPSDVVRDAAILVAVDSRGRRVKAMHPFHCMVSRIANVLEVPDKYDNPHGLSQLNASIFCVREFIAARLRAGDLRGALDDVEDVFSFCQEKNAIELFLKTNTDISLSVLPREGLPEKFYTLRLPQLQAELKAIRRA